MNNLFIRLFVLQQEIGFWCKNHRIFALLGAPLLLILGISLAMIGLMVYQGILVRFLQVG